MTYSLLRLALICCVIVTACRGTDRRVKIQTYKTSTGFELVLLPGGSFEMGSKIGDKDEQPIHEVTISPFLIDRHEVPQNLYAAIAKNHPGLVDNPSRFKDPDRPVEMVSWIDAVLFCNERSRQEGLKSCYDEETGKCDFSANGYRLPTEAEWEYACRAGSTTDFSYGANPADLTKYGWRNQRTTKRIALKEPNTWGLYDMHGNVAEWCNDQYSENYYSKSPPNDPRGPAEGPGYVYRGGGWDSSETACRSAARSSLEPLRDACFARNNIGFRCVRNAQ
jgi:formylglycine-generating enzyme required for sulfatase activity